MDLFIILNLSILDIFRSNKTALEIYPNIWDRCNLVSSIRQYNCRRSQSKSDPFLSRWEFLGDPWATLSTTSRFLHGGNGGNGGDARREGTGVERKRVKKSWWVIYNRKNNGKWVGRDERTSARGARGASTARLLVGYVLSLYYYWRGWWVHGPTEL